jgi:hypothetical protein
MFSWLALTEDVELAPGDVKVPDAHFALKRSKVPANLRPSYSMNNLFGGNLSPCLVFEVSVSNESMRQLSITDFNRYFAAGGGTRAWMGIKLFKDTRNPNPNPVHRWWVGWAKRDKNNAGAFLDSATLHTESFPVVASHNVPVSTPCNIVFHIDTTILFEPMLKPPGYPPTINIDLELIRQVILESL